MDVEPVDDLIVRPAGQQPAHVAEQRLFRPAPSRAGSAASGAGLAGGVRRRGGGNGSPASHPSMAARSWPASRKPPAGIDFQAAQDQLVQPAMVVADLVLHLRRRREAEALLDAVMFLAVVALVVGVPRGARCGPPPVNSSYISRPRLYTSDAGVDRP